MKVKLFIVVLSAYTVYGYNEQTSDFNLTVKETFDYNNLTVGKAVNLFSSYGLAALSIKVKVLFYNLSKYLVHKLLRFDYIV